MTNVKNQLKQASIEEVNHYTQLCVWEGVLIPEQNKDGKTGVEQFVKWIEDEFDVAIKFAEEVKTLPGKGGEGGRNDVFFYIYDNDIPRFAVKRLSYGIRWWEDVLGNGNGCLYPQEILEKYSKTW